MSEGTIPLIEGEIEGVRADGRAEHGVCGASEPHAAAGRVGLDPADGGGVAQTVDGLKLHLEWWRGYYHYMRPHESLRVNLGGPSNVAAAEPATLSAAHPGDGSGDDAASLECSGAAGISCTAAGDGRVVNERKTAARLMEHSGLIPSGQISSESYSEAVEPSRRRAMNYQLCLNGGSEARQCHFRWLVILVPELQP